MVITCGRFEKNVNLIVASSLERRTGGDRHRPAPRGRRRYPPESKVERNNYRWWYSGLGPMVAVPAARPSTNRRAATAHDICMRAARTTPPLKYTRTDGEITREANIYKMSPPTAPLAVACGTPTSLSNYTHETCDTLLFTTIFTALPSHSSS